MYLLPAIHVLLSVLPLSGLVYTQSQCDAKVYGKPNVNDCFDLYKQLPGETLSPGINPDAPRSFVEPKYLEPPFTPVPNPYSTSMVQLPKIWRAGEAKYLNATSSTNSDR